LNGDWAKRLEGKPSNSRRTHDGSDARALEHVANVQSCDLAGRMLISGLAMNLKRDIRVHDDLLSKRYKGGG
jgi:hypothetical protein